MSRLEAQILGAKGLYHTYPVKGRFFGAAKRLVALDDVSLSLKANETLGILGESGSGKSTLARLLAGLETPDRGAVIWEGEDITALDEAALRPRRSFLAMVFQDPAASLNPRLSVLESVAEPLDALRLAPSPPARRETVAAMLERVGLPADMMARYPHQFSGGQRQRIALARALITRPKVLIADEPVSALDVSVQAQIINLLLDLKAEMGLGLVFISHDVALTRHIADRLMVMEKGRVIEAGDAEHILRNPQEAYTKTLLESAAL